MQAAVDWSQAPPAADHWLVHEFGATWGQRIKVKLHHSDPDTIPAIAALAPAPTFGAAIGTQADRPTA